MSGAAIVHEKRFDKELALSQSPTVSGCKAIKWDEGGATVSPVTIGVDSNCLFFYWTDQHRRSECLDLATVRDTRTGDKKARIPQDESLLHQCLIGDEPTADRCMTIVYGNSYVNLRFMSFIFTKSFYAQFWTGELFQLAYNYKTHNISLERTLLKIYTRLKIKSAPEVRITVKDIIQYFYSDNDDQQRCDQILDSHKNDPILLEKFQFKDFLRLYSQITRRPDLESVFVGLAGSKRVKYLTLTQMRDFLNQTQRDPRLNEVLHPPFTTETTRALIDKYEPHESFRTEGRISQDGFVRFLMSDSNAVVSPNCFTLHQDMGQPLSHYFINSSHNTYLVGAQIRGKSSAEMYRQALLSGYRCIELDCWDGEDGKPIITHGHTLTIRISAKEALDAVAEYAFKTSDYPLVLSLENHCCAQQQDILAIYLKQVFGPALLDKPMASHPLEGGISLPSPEQLKNRVLVKNKKHAPITAAALVRMSSSCNPMEMCSDSDTDDEADETPFDFSESDVNVLNHENHGVGTAVTPMVETELSRLVNYVQPMKFDSFDAAEKRDHAFKCVSLVEDRAMVFLEKNPVQFIDFNKRQLTRVYPTGKRVISSNFQPFQFWNAGCQMVALNVQTPDLGMQLNTAVFGLNGGSGYLIKPEPMRQKNRTLDPFIESHVDGVVPVSISIRIISGLMLSLKRISTYVEVDIYGMVADIDQKNHRTRPCPSNGINPQYEQANQPFAFRVMLPDMAYLRISVREERTSCLIGHCLLPVSHLRPGYRHVVLQNEIGQILSATVFIFTEIKDYIPNFHINLANALENPIYHLTEYDRRKKLEELAVSINDPENQNPEVTVLKHELLPEQSTDASGFQSIKPINGDANDRPFETLLSEERLVSYNHAQPTLHTEVRHDVFDHHSSPLGTPPINRPSLPPENSDDMAARKRLQQVRAPTLEELKHQTKAIQKMLTKQNKELEKIQLNYEQNVKRLELMHAKEHEKNALEQDKSRSVQAKSNSKLSTTMLSSSQPYDVTGELDKLIKRQKEQRLQLLKRQSDARVKVRREYHQRELEVNLRYHYLIYHTLETEMTQQQSIVIKQLENAKKVNLDEMKAMVGLQVSKDLAELKLHKDLDKNQMKQKQKEVTQNNIHQGVFIAERYEVLYEDRKKVLTEEIKMIMQQAKREKTLVEQDLKAKFAEKSRLLDEQLRMNSILSSSSTGSDHQSSRF